jgi:hypothetical protein
VGWAHQRIEAALRTRRQALCAQAESVLRAGGAPRWSRLMGRALAAQAAATFLLLAVCLCAVGPVLRALCLRAPFIVVDGFGFGLALAPWLALGVAAHALWRRPA